MVCVEKETRGRSLACCAGGRFFSRSGARPRFCMAKPEKTTEKPRLLAKASLLTAPDGTPTGVITLMGEVEEWWGENNVATYAADIEALKLQGATSLTVRINSKGGDVMEANGMAGVLKNCGLHTRAEIYGVCASAATFVAMACDECYMAEGSLYMIHEPWGSITGTCAEMRTRLDLYERLRADMVSLYAEKCGKSEEDVVAMLSPEKWMSAQEAADMGFVTGVLGTTSDMPLVPADGSSDPAAQEEQPEEKPAETEPAAQEEEEEKRGLGARLMDAVTGKDSPAAVKAKQEVADLRAELAAAKAAADGAAALAAKLQADLTALRDTEEQRVQQRAAELTASAVPASDTLPRAGVMPKSWQPDDVKEALKKGGVSAAVNATLGI